MIRYSLLCEDGHQFAAWFASSAVFDTQVQSGLVACPVCGSVEISKALMAPAVALSEGTQPEGQLSAYSVDALHPTEKEQAFRAMIRMIRAEVVKNAEDVGSCFAEEMRKMHYGEADVRFIHGQATPEEARGMAEEGIEFLQLPSLPDDGN